LRADYAENEWADYPQGAKPLIPTVYNGGGSSSSSEKKPAKPSLVEMVLYNMAAMMAGVAAGYDVRHSNVSAIHPKLHPDRLVSILTNGAKLMAGTGSLSMELCS
jgi:hypothetical protein